MFESIRQRFSLILIMLILMFGVIYVLVIFFIHQQSEALKRRKAAIDINYEAQELARSFWSLRFWEKSILGQSQDADKHFADVLERMQKKIHGFQNRASHEDIKRKVAELARLLSQYEKSFNELIQLTIEQQLNQTNLDSEYHMLAANILMEDKSELIRPLFNLAHFQKNYFISRKKTQYKGMNIVISSLERRVERASAMDERSASYLRSYRERLEDDWALNKSIQAIIKKFDVITLNMNSLLDDISRKAIKQYELETKNTDILFSKLRNKFLFSAGFSVLFLFTVIYILARRIVRPIQDLSRVVTRVEKGDLTARFASRQKDELSDLGMAVNQMIKSIDENQSKLHAYQLELENKVNELAASQKELQKHRHNLEELIEERTKDLAAAN